MRRYLYHLGVLLDCALNTILLNGDPHVTISEHAADAQRDGERWGCWLCEWLSATVEKNHCANMLSGKAITRLGALRAVVQLLSVAIVLDGAIRILLRLFW